MNIVYATDKNYIPLVKVSICSFLEHFDYDEKVTIYILGYYLEEKEQEELKGLVESKKQCNLFIIPVEQYVNILPVGDEFPIMSYARLFLADIIKEEKVLYLDCDTLILENLKELGEIELNSCMVAGVQDTVDARARSSVGLIKSERYINAGILILNLEKMRQQNFTTRVIQYLNERKGSFLYNDQGVLNALCKGCVLYLQPEYNMMMPFLKYNTEKIEKYFEVENFYKQTMLEHAKNSPKIIHFAGSMRNRPWFEQCNAPYAEEWRYIVKKYNIQVEIKKGKSSLKDTINHYLPLPIQYHVKRIYRYICGTR